MCFNELWGELKLHKSRPPIFNIVFMFRRVVYSAIIVVPLLLEIPAIFQMMLMINLNLWMCAWLVDATPFSSKKLNRVEICNELGNLCITYMLIVQNNNRNGDDLYEMGVLLNYVIIGLFLANIIFVLYTVSNEQLLKCKRQYKKRVLNALPVE